MFSLGNWKQTLEKIAQLLNLPLELVQKQVDSN